MPCGNKHDLTHFETSVCSGCGFAVGCAMCKPC